MVILHLPQRFLGILPHLILNAKMVHLLVLGGNGRTGQYGIQYALEKGVL